MKENSTRDLVITRIFDAPRALVWKAWADPERIKRWWGPDGFTLPCSNFDFRVGGAYHYCMRSPEGRDYWAKGVYREIDEPERILFTDSFADEQGNTVRATHYGLSPDWPEEALVTVTFDSLEGNKTRLTLRHAGVPPGEDSDCTEMGWTQSLERLAAVLADPST